MCMYQCHLQPRVFLVIESLHCHVTGWGQSLHPYEHQGRVALG
jgi:hypothetical protein